MSNEDHFEHHAPYGGQAVIEGVMMRSPRFYAVACRRPDNEIVVIQESVDSYLKRFHWLNKPFLRGTLALVDALILGMKSLTFSAGVAMEQAEKPAAAPNPPGSPDSRAVETNEVEASAAHGKGEGLSDIAVGFTLMAGMGLAILIFVVAPQLLVGMTERWITKPVLLNLAAGVVKLIFFITYLLVISMMKDIKRVFEYHGAEHKVINTFEAGEELTCKNFAAHPTIHPRCGTSFLLIVVVLSILVFCLLSWHSAWYIRVIQRIALLPIIAGIAYEFIRFAGKHRDSVIVRALFAPGLWLQRLTTREPSEAQVEVAQRALQAVIDKEREAGLTEKRSEPNCTGVADSISQE